MPLITARGDRRHGRGPRGVRRGGDDRDHGARRPRRATAASSAPATATSSGWWRRRRPATRRRPELAIREVNAGLYCFDGGALLDALAELDADNAQGELYLRTCCRSCATGAWPPTLLADADLALGVNDRVDLAHVTRSRRPAVHAAHQRAGVTIVDPRSTLIDAGVTIRQDTTIEPSTFLARATASAPAARSAR